VPRGTATHKEAELILRRLLSYQRLDMPTVALYKEARDFSALSQSCAARLLVVALGIGTVEDNPYPALWDWEDRGSPGALVAIETAAEFAANGPAQPLNRQALAASRGELKAITAALDN